MFTTHAAVLATPSFVAACAALEAASQREVTARRALETARKEWVAASRNYRSAYGPDGQPCPTAEMDAAVTTTAAAHRAATAECQASANAFYAAVYAKDKALPEFSTHIQTRDEALVEAARRDGRWNIEHRTSFYLTAYYVLTPKRGSDAVMLTGGVKVTSCYDAMLERSSQYLSIAA
jgi:hypothetical protein